MNPTLESNRKLRHAERVGSASGVAMLARGDATSAPPASGTAYAGEKAIANAFKPLLGDHRYWVAQTRVAMIFAALMLVALIAVGWLMTPSLLMGGLIAFLMAGLIISCYHWIFYQWGPAWVNEQRHAAASQQLEQSGDAHAPPAGLLSMLMLIGVLTVDGFLSGASLTQTMFAKILTPKMALLAAVAWGVVATALLFKLVHDAARESAICSRRNLIRQLLASNDPTDQARGRAMIAAVGTALGHDFSARANSWFSRGVLAIALVVLAGSIFLLRYNEPAGPSTDPGGVETEQMPTGFRDAFFRA
ncbi:MAG: hypothetical protein ACKOF9_01430 [Burkholderiales bacterium]